MHLSSVIFLQPNRLIYETTSSSSLVFIIPVEMIRGFFVLVTFFNKGKCIFSAEAIL